MREYIRADAGHDVGSEIIWVLAASAALRWRESQPHLHFDFLRYRHTGRPCLPITLNSSGAKEVGVHQVDVRAQKPLACQALHPVVVAPGRHRRHGRMPDEAEVAGISNIRFRRPRREIGTQKASAIVTSASA